MIRVGRVARPKNYDGVKERGDAWLRANRSAKRPKDLWAPFLPHLAEGFSHLCGYAAMLDPTGGTVDHYLSWRTRPDLAYEWTNFRFVSQLLNCSKRDADDRVLDPYRVEQGWFEILLPSLQMRVTERVPASQRRAAEFTLKRLKLGDGEKIVRWRRHYYERFQAGSLSLDGLRVFAPLIADAVEREREAPRPAKRRRSTVKKAPKGVTKKRG